MTDTCFRLAASIALVLVVACAGPDLRARADAMTKGCVQSPTTGGVQFVCDGWVGGIGEAVSATPEQMLLGNVAGMRAAFIDRGTTVLSETRVDGTLGGLPTLGLRMRLRSEAGEATVRVVALREEDGRTRLLTCAPKVGVPDPERLCDGFFEAWARVALPPPPPAPDTLRLVGVDVAAPPGCTIRPGRNGSGQIRCEDGAFLSGYRIVGGSVAQAERFAGEVNGALRKAFEGVRDGEPLPCTVGGLPMTCRVLVVPGEDGLRILTAAGMVGSDAWVLQCGQGPAVEGVHPVCAAAMTF